MINLFKRGSNAMSMTPILKAIPLSFYSRSFYHEVGQTWKGRSFLYLFILLLITWFGTSFFFTRHVMQNSEKMMLIILDQMPTLQFKQGKVSTTKPGIFYIRDPDNQKVLIVIDTANQYQNFNKSSALLLVRQEGIWRKENLHKSSVYSFPKSFSGTVGPKELNPLFCKFKQFGPIVIFGVTFLLGLVAYYALEVLFGLFFGFVGWMLGRFSKISMDYTVALSIALVAMTPAIIINSIFSWIAGMPSSLGWISFIITLVYLYFGIRSMQGRH